ncbi:MAG: GNAT family N-acetyltransferase, partial [Thiotrichales bacterium]|nr:GNAT family N-acetyltransferase [Thiotrichales bacterium]
MTEPAYRIEIVDWDQHSDDIRAVRTSVFIEELGVPESLEWDDQDNLCLHLLARNNKGTIIGTARLLDSGQIGRLAVLKPY